MSRRLLSGLGWRIGWLPNAQAFPGLVGGEDWAIELTAQELEDFSKLSWQLVDIMQQMQSELSEQEKLTCTATTELVELEATGYPNRFSLHLQLQTGRRCEGMWNDTATFDLLAAIEQLSIELNFKNC